MRAILAAEGRSDISVVEEYKGSYLAPLLALNQESRSAAGGGLQPVDGMKETAKRVLVRLEGSQVVLSEMSEVV